MSGISKEYIEHQRKRWMRHDAHRFIRHDAWRFLPPSERFEAKFDPDQPRVPAGSSEGGQWAAGGGSAEAAADIAEVVEGLWSSLQWDAYPHRKQQIVRPNISKTSGFVDFLEQGPVGTGIIS